MTYLELIFYLQAEMAKCEQPEQEQKYEKRIAPYSTTLSMLLNTTPPAAQPEQEPVAWRDPTNIDPGQGCTYTKERREKWPHIYRQALYTAPPAAQPEPTPWRDIVVVALVREGIDKHRARELADHFAAQRPWVGLTEKDWEYVKDSKGTSLDTFDHGAAWAADQLMKRNT